MKRKVKIHQTRVNTAKELDLKDVLAITIENISSGTAKPLLGWNERANKGVNEVSTVKSYGLGQDIYLDGNKLFIDFTVGGTEPDALITIFYDAGEKCD